MRQQFKNALMDISLALATLTPEERVDAMFSVRHSYCFDCGFPAPPDSPLGLCGCTEAAE